jgi:TusA-related sulfurtransferase
MTSSKDAARSLVIYFTSPEEKHDFAEWAKKAGSSLSP